MSPPADPPPPEPPARAVPPAPPVPLVLSCAMGGIGVVLLLLGAVVGNAGLSVAGVVAGTASLGAALYWRSLLITAWAARKEPRLRR